MTWNRQARTNERVQHVPTSAIGLVIVGGWCPRIQWEPTGRVSRIDTGELRSLGMDEQAVKFALLLENA